MHTHLVSVVTVAGICSWVVVGVFLTCHHCASGGYWMLVSVKARVVNRKQMDVATFRDRSGCHCMRWYGLH